MAFSVVGVLFSLGCAAPSVPVLDDGLAGWVDAATAGRADVLAIGDSVVLHGGDGWDAGLIHGLHGTVGVAGTGVLAGRSAGQGEGYHATNTFASGWSSALGDAHGDVTTHGAFGRLTATARTEYGLLINGTTLPGGAAYELDLWVAGDSTGVGTYDLQRRLGASPWTPASASSGHAAPATGAVHHATHTLPASGQGSAQVRVFASDLTLMGARLSVPGATGATVTSLGYGGRSTLDFLQDFWGTRTPAARAALLDRVVDGGSGRLLVPIFEGFNDRNESEPSAGSNPDGDSPEAFVDNVDASIDGVRDAWADTGRPASDLQFVTFGMYDIASGNDELIGYAGALEAYATDEPGVSFVDLRGLGPGYDEGVTLGYYADSIHLSRAGALYYGERIVQTLVPEPASGVAVLTGVTIAFGRRRRRSRHG